MSELTAKDDMLKLYELPSGPCLRINKKYIRLHLVNGVVQNKLTKRQHVFVKAHLEG